MPYTVREQAEGWDLVEPIEMRHRVAKIMRDGRFRMWMVHERCTPKLPDWSHLEYSGGCLLHHWGGVPFLDNLEEECGDSNWKRPTRGYGSVHDFLSESAPCECCDYDEGAYAIGNGDWDKEAVIEQAREMLVVFAHHKVEVHMMPGEIEMWKKGTLGWVARATKWWVRVVDI